MRTLIIHPDDPTTYMLRRLYSWLAPDSFTLMTGSESSSTVRNALSSGIYERVMLLGHGSECGLFSPYGGEQFGRTIISPQNVQSLRQIEIIGIWCNANIFAGKYNLTGLFSGMVISELSEALDWNVPATEDEILNHREIWAENLAQHIRENWNDLSRVPDLMNSHIISGSSFLEQFNYQSVYYYINEDCDE